VSKEIGVEKSKPAKILYIEDDQEMIDLVCLILNRRGFQVKGAQGGRSGLEAIRNEDFDLLLLDLMMPDLDGWDLYHILKADEKTRDIPVIVITAKSQPVDKVLGLYIAKVEDYISKPFHPEDLINSIEKVLEKSMHPDG
jgi:DNA-binding response OmpR family regulator